MGNVVIAGTGSFLPSFVLTNYDFEMMVDTSDEWIVTRTGIKERRICPKNMASSDMGVEAAKAACKDAGISFDKIDFIICATVSPDKFFPSTACIIQAKLGIKDIPAFDISAACSGFIFGLEIARSLISGGGYKTGLVIASECMSRLTDYTDRSICVLLGDGAGAAIVKVSEEEGIMGSYVSSDGSYGDILNAPAGGSARPASFDTVEKRMHFMKMEGAVLFKIAIETMCEAINKLLKRFNLKKEDISLIVPHQANLRIINGVAKGMGMPPEKFYVNIEKYGNMSAACIPIALDEASKKGLIKKGDIVATVAFGGGLTWGANLIKWTK
ncbi:MAG: ketoacyl-ACP synthase III [Candidatus Omnitrophica bacterium]|nr:ketoacyl-ACP synthase III [Candidatus Omnitrophota bacterium]MCM8777280.1 ketoacyl-ACP synthase III [Candidatus Omnitrophota bacterium]